MPRLVQSPVLWSLGLVVAGLGALLAGVGFGASPSTGEAQQATATATATPTPTTTATPTPTTVAVRVRKVTMGGRAVPDVATTQYAFRLTCADGTDATATAKSGETVLIAGAVTRGTTCNLVETDSGGSRSTQVSAPGPAELTADRTYTVTNHFDFRFDITMETRGAGPILQSRPSSLRDVSLRLDCTVGSGINAVSYTRNVRLFVSYQSVSLPPTRSRP